ncbi:MAG: two-component system response regulator [Desulfobacterales bacterium]|nr:two-component system response regulator [Desulfobacterales bacterium]
MIETDKKEKILIVDDTPVNIRMLASVLKDDYKLIFATNGTKALNILEQEELPDLILLDIIMPDIDGYEVMQKVKNNEKTKDIPVIFITSMTEEDNETKGLGLGAVDYITKPFSLSIVKARIKTHLKLKQYQSGLEDLVKLRTQEILETQIEIVERLARASEYRDCETGMHIKRLSHYSLVIANKYGMNKSECELLFHASPMHDVGKIGIPDRILLKPGPLDAEEWQIMKSHTVIGSELLGGHHSKLLRIAQIIALTHHEKWDGSGYPRGIKSEEIPIEGRVVALCDVFDALTSKRPYKKPWTVEEAIAEINKQKGKHFDPKLVELFNSIIPEILSIKERLAD